MVAKLKAQFKVRKRRALPNLPVKKQKKLNGKDKPTSRRRDDMVGSMETSKAQQPSLGDEFEEENSEESAEEISEEGFSDEDEEGLTVKTESFLSTLKADSPERDLSSDENMDEEENSEESAEEISEEGFSDEDEEGLNVKTESFLSTLKADSPERDLSSDENMDEEQNNVQGLLYADRDEEMEALDKEYRELQAQEVDMLRSLKGRSDEEVLKGRAVRSQKALWDKALEVRILLQKPFSNANRLPTGDGKLQMSELNKEVENAFGKLSASGTKTLSFLHETLKALLNQNDSLNRDTAQENGGRFVMELSDDIDTIWDQISASYSRFVPFRNSTVDRWQRKTQLSSGAAASKTKLRAFNQSISQQIETQMRDFSRMLQRMCLKRSSVEIIGEPSIQPQTSTYPDDSRTDLQESSKDLNGDPELIDDTEFYQELLREFIESSDPSSVGAIYAARKLHKKNRKVVDRRASKGRKIRYNVHDKIVNFMAPVPMSMPPMAEKLFSNGLFRGGASL